MTLDLKQLPPVKITNVYSNFNQGKKDITYGYIDMSKRTPQKETKAEEIKKEKILAGIGSISGVALSLAYLMKKQHQLNPLKLKINKISRMIPMAAAANAGGILLSSIGEQSDAIKKKWKEGAFQILLTSTPMLLVDSSIKLCEKTKSKLINNNFTKLGISAIGVYIGSHFAIEVSNRLRNDKEGKKPKRKLKPVDMIANLDDAVAMMVLAKIPFADKIKIDKLLPFIYSFCGYRSGTGDKRQN